MYVLCKANQKANLVDLPLIKRSDNPVLNVILPANTLQECVFADENNAYVACDFEQEQGDVVKCSIKRVNGETYDFKCLLSDLFTCIPNHVISKISPYFRHNDTVYRAINKAEAGSALFGVIIGTHHIVYFQSSIAVNVEWLMPNQVKELAKIRVEYKLHETYDSTDGQLKCIVVFDNGSALMENKYKSLVYVFDKNCDTVCCGKVTEDAEFRMVKLFYKPSVPPAYVQIDAFTAFDKHGVIRWISELRN